MGVSKAIVLAGAAGLLLGAAAVAHAQDAPQPATPPAWNTLVHCAEMPNEDARLACYDAAMRAAGYAPKPAEVAADKRRRFGLTIPQINILKHHGEEEGAQAASGQAPSGQAAPGEQPAAAPAKPPKAAKPPKHAAAAPPPRESEDEVTVELTQVAKIQPTDRLIFFTTDGAIWEQVDQIQVSPTPRPGQAMLIHRGRLGGGYFCDASKSQSVRCKRDR